MMSTFTAAPRQVWYAQSPLSEPCRGTLCTLPVLPGQMFGAAAQQALECSTQVDKAKQQFADLQQSPLPRPRHTVAPRPPLRPVWGRPLLAACGAPVPQALPSIFGREARSLCVLPHLNLSPASTSGGCPARPPFSSLLHLQSGSGSFMPCPSLASICGGVRRGRGDSVAQPFFPSQKAHRYSCELSYQFGSQSVSGQQPPSAAPLCPVWALKRYIEVFAAFCQIDALLCYGGHRKGRALSKQRLSHWSMGTIAHAYRLPRVTSHSTRGRLHVMGGFEGPPAG